VVAAAPLHRPLERMRPAAGLAIAALLGAVLLVALVKLPTYTLNMVDGPDIAALDLRDWFGRALVALNLLILVLWVRHKQLALQLYLFVTVPAALYFGAVASTAYLGQLVNPWPADKAGDFAHRFVPKAEHKAITVAGTELQNLMRVQFHIDDKDTGLLDLPDPHQPIEHYQLPPNGKWLLVVGEHALPSGIKPLVSTPDYALVRLEAVGRTLGTSDLVRPIGDALIERIDGLSYSESLGRWSTGKQVVIHFRRPLPKRFNFAFKAQSFGPNATAPFVLRADGLALPFRLSTVPQEIGLHVDTDGTLRSLTIEVPHPISPMDVGPSVDTRTIGLAISEISIGELEPAAPQSQAQR
jgi:phosphoglycerol transferase